MIVLAWLFGVVVLVVVIAALVTFLNHFYRKSSRDVAIIRTGFGGQKTLISGGCLSLPFLRQNDLGAGQLSSGLGVCFFRLFGRQSDGAFQFAYF